VAVSIGVSARAAVVLILRVGLGVLMIFTNAISDFEVAPVSGIIAMLVLSGTLAISPVGLEVLCLTGPHSPVEKIKTIPIPIVIEKNNMTNNTLRFKFILSNITAFR
jgi:hypothetical protein